MLGTLSEPRPRLLLEVTRRTGTARHYETRSARSLGLRQEDLEKMHDLWLQITSDPHFAGAHHYTLSGWLWMS